MTKIAALVTFLALSTLAGCSASPPEATVPSVHSSTGSPTGSAVPPGGSGAGRAAALHDAAQCIRTHGVPSYQDPVLTAEGHVYTDARSIQDLAASAEKQGGAPDGVLDAIRTACGSLITAAGFQPDDVSSAPSALVQAGVKAARCLRANGLPDFRDPTSSTPFTPGHGFGMTNDELPNHGALGKKDPAVQRAFEACRSLLDAETAASTLTSLARD